ncbi:MAG: aspartate aminotransferase family protein [Candidatus Alcyoniella australis]|nr:aspartate aminotransferase family protein [Candidatus Alcyoniella australis]
MKIPQKGRTREQILEDLESFRVNDLKWRDGKTFGYVYDPGKEAEEVGKKAYMMYLTENGLDPTSFPSLLRLENEIVAMSASNVEGDENVVGNFTSGGTESIMLAVKSARDYNRKHKPQITAPEMVLPITAHAAFHKAAKYLGVKVVPVDVDHQTFKALPELIEEAITENTVLIVNSSPSYAHGVIDPIEQVAAIAKQHGILMHVDACVGGFQLPYYRRLGEPIPYFGFSIEGVTSISMDLHKYAYCPKGASIVLYRNKDIRKAQFFACASWTGYTVINAAVQSSKSGGPMAAAWAVLNHFGDEGYLEMAREQLKATKAAIAGIKAIPGLSVLSQPEMCLVAFTSTEINIFHIIDEMKELGWYIQAQFSLGCSPQNIHLSINFMNVEHVDALLADLRTCAEKARGMGFDDDLDQIKSVLSMLDPAQVDPEVFNQALGMAGISTSALPGRMAPVNEILNSLSPEMREFVLIEFLNNLFHYSEE